MKPEDPTFRFGPEFVKALKDYQHDVGRRAASLIIDGVAGPDDALRIADQLVQTHRKAVTEARKRSGANSVLFFPKCG